MDFKPALRLSEETDARMMGKEGGVSMKRNVLEYLENTVSVFPERTAVSDGQNTMTWRELHEASLRIGSAIAERIGPRKPCVVIAEKGAMLLSVFLGAVQAGCFYVLLNPAHPKERLKKILKVLGAECCIADPEHMELAAQLLEKGKILNARELCRFPYNRERLRKRREGMTDLDPLYANFTSGSTGVPKGVLISHRSVLDFIDCFTEEFPVSERDVIASQAPFDFDVSVKDIYTSLKTGAQLHIVPRALFSKPAMLIDDLCRSRATILIWAVSALCLVSAFHGLDYRVPETVRRVMFSGEVMPLKHLHIWMEKLAHAEFVNLYGPTEITCNCTFHRISRKRDYSGGIPIGKPFANEKVFLLDENDRSVDCPGKTGEICVCGTALALGYCRNPSDTASSFVNNPLQTLYPERMYRTGDLAFYGDDGELMFAGRRDFQIKFMGHRIELEEIERAAEQIEGVERMRVIFDEKRQRLTGFYTGRTDSGLLHGRMRQLLPSFMVPSQLISLTVFPLTENGKIDRKALLERRHIYERRDA